MYIYILDILLLHVIVLSLSFGKQFLYGNSVPPLLLSFTYTLLLFIVYLFIYFIMMIVIISCSCTVYFCTVVIKLKLCIRYGCTQVARK